VTSPIPLAVPVPLGLPALLPVPVPVEPSVPVDPNEPELAVPVDISVVPVVPSTVMVELTTVNKQMIKMLRMRSIFN
jgi:hypothetical protein